MAFFSYCWCMCCYSYTSVTASAPISTPAAMAVAVQRLITDLVLLQLATIISVHKTHTHFLQHSCYYCFKHRKPSKAADELQNKSDHRKLMVVEILACWRQTFSSLIVMMMMRFFLHVSGVRHVEHLVETTLFFACLSVEVFFSVPAFSRTWELTWRCRNFSASAFFS